MNALTRHREIAATGAIPFPAPAKPAALPFRNFARAAIGALRNITDRETAQGNYAHAYDVAKFLRDYFSDVPCIGPDRDTTRFVQHVYDSIEHIEGAVVRDRARRAGRPVCDISASALAAAGRALGKFTYAVLRDGERVPFAQIDDLDDVVAFVKSREDWTFEAASEIVRAWFLERCENGEPEIGVSDIAAIARAGTAPFFRVLVEDDASREALRIALRDAADEWEERA